MPAPKCFYEATNANTGSSGFTNYMGRMTPEQRAALHTTIEDTLGECVIVNGDDDLRADLSMRPEYAFMEYAKTTGHEVLAHYHSGVSGITKSGIIVTPEVFDTLSEWYEKRFGFAIDAKLKLVFLSDSTALYGGAPWPR